MKDILEKIHKVQLESFCKLETFRHKDYLKILPTNHRGLYWLWTSLTLDELQMNTLPNIRKEVPISRLVEHRKLLNNICRIEKNDYVVVYNGIGGYHKSKSSGLRERIKQEVKGNGETVGTLNILKNSDISKWAVSYFDFDAPENAEIIEELNSASPYKEYAKDLEMLWRLHYGTPILTRH
ncbi:hypothetical protein SAMN05443667_115123 [Flavobacterium gillisiae]|uniref:Uncharacterized protein n=1 Tax=Flavobacterium gillisiae TaxID=150146 RepID=A0A1H4FYP3_9FLAO|nr:hypothetical protein [Flavobacterium gillisiae]SEB02404.1 hypothetical protein SAMN05443667_115123 [Flavobacterium gillisiae]